MLGGGSASKLLLNNSGIAFSINNNYMIAAARITGGILPISHTIQNRNH